MNLSKEFFEFEQVTVESDTLHTWIVDSCPGFVELNIVKYAGTMIGSNGFLHRWTNPRFVSRLSQSAEKSMNLWNS